MKFERSSTSRRILITPMIFNGMNVRGIRMRWGSIGKI